MSQVTDFPENETRPGKETEGGEGTGGLSTKLRKLSPLARVGKFYRAVKLEMRRTTWPARSEVWSTTVVVLIAIVFFGFYLYGADYVIAMGFKALEKVFK